MNKEDIYMYVLGICHNELDFQDNPEVDAILKPARMKVEELRRALEEDRLEERICSTKRELQSLNSQYEDIKWRRPEDFACRAVVNFLRRVALKKY